MAAGVVYHNLTTATGVSFTVGSWVPDTAAPDVGALPIMVLLNSAGAALATGAGAAGSTVLRVTTASDDPIVTAITGTVADDATDSGNSAKIAGVVHAGLSGDTALAAGKRAAWAMDADRVGLTRSVPLEDIVSGVASNTDGSSTEVIAAATSGIKQYLRKVSLSNTHATTSVMVALKSGTTSRWRVNVPPGGREINFDPPLAPNAAAEAWNFDPDTGVSTIECAMLGFKSKV